MVKKSLFIIYLLLLCFNQTYSQPICTGKMLNAKDGKIDICFLRTPNPIGNNTKYTIFLNGTEIYEVDFNYIEDGDSVIIKFYDKQSTTVKRQSVKLNPEDSHFLICDFTANNKTINNNKNYQILFGIDHPDQQFITLYQFQAIGGVQTQFILQDVPPTVLNDHSKAVLDYEKIISMREEHDYFVARLKREMILYSDSIKNSIIEKENALQLKEATLTADNALQSSFTKTMDSIFIGYFKNTFSYNDEAFDVSFIFNCDGLGKIKIDTIKTIYFKKGTQKNWLRDSFMLRIKPRIEMNIYKTITDSYTNPKLKTDFSDWFEKSFIIYTNLGESDRALFTEMQQKINEELEPYITRNRTLPTIYSYAFKYNSAVKYPTWKFVKEGDGNDKFIDKSDKEDKVEITESLKKIFKNKFSTVGSGKYNLKISTVSINNDAFIGQDIELIEKK